MTSKLITFDCVLKRLRRSKANFGILEGFISQLNEDIIILEILEIESNKDHEKDKYNRVMLTITGKEILEYRDCIESAHDLSPWAKTKRRDEIFARREGGEEGERIEVKRGKIEVLKQGEKNAKLQVAEYLLKKVISISDIFLVAGLNKRKINSINN